MISSLSASGLRHLTKRANPFEEDVETFVVNRETS